VIGSAPVHRPGQQVLACRSFFPPTLEVVYPQVPVVVSPLPKASSTIRRPANTRANPHAPRLPHPKKQNHGQAARRSSRGLRRPGPTGNTTPAPGQQPLALKNTTQQPHPNPSNSHPQPSAQLAKHKTQNQPQLQPTSTGNQHQAHARSVGRRGSPRPLRRPRRSANRRPAAGRIETRRFSRSQPNIYRFQSPLSLCLPYKGDMVRSRSAYGRRRKAVLAQMQPQRAPGYCRATKGPTTLATRPRPRPT
jgi:hypothetical protein